MPVSQLNNTLSIWIVALQGYNFDRLLKKPGSEAWSLGQVFVHLIEETSYYMEQVQHCLTTNENAAGGMTEEASAMFANNAFPNSKIRRGPLLSQNVPQPESKIDILNKMQSLQGQANLLWDKVNSSTFAGKTKHPGLGYFSAREWLQFADMHLRHHLKQKDRIEEALKDK